MAFTLVHRQKAYVQIAEQIIESIRRGEFRPGDRLPSVRELEAKFGVSRPSVREALSALELVGIVETRTGQGTFVLDPSLERTERSLLQFDHGESPAEVLEVRLILEPEGARLAAERATEEDLKVLAISLESLRTIAGERTPAIVGDIQFHVAVAKASRNPVIQRVVESLTGYLAQALWRSLRQRAWMHEDLARTYLEHHEHTFAAIRAHEGLLSARSMREHLEHVVRDLFN